MRLDLSRFSRRRMLAALAIGAVAVAGVATLPILPAFAATGCSVTYTIGSTWPGNFGASTTIQNLGDPLTSWRLEWDFGDPGQHVTQANLWNGTVTQTGQHVTVTNVSYNGTVASNAFVSPPPGFNGQASGANPVPTRFTLNGTVCNGTTQTGPPPTTTSSATPPVNRPPRVSLSVPPGPFTAPATILLQATATDPDAGDSVTKVDFFDGSTVIGTDTTSPYSFNWTNVAAGTHDLRAIATDTHGATNPMDPLPITVNPGQTTGAAPALHVSGNMLLTASNTPYRLLGANRSGGEFQCIHGFGMWDGPVDQASITAIRSWKIRAIRIPLNEECWLGNGVVPAGDIPTGGTQGAAYQQAVKDYVNLLITNGITPIVEMHWSVGTYTGNSAGACAGGPQNLPANTPIAACQKPMPDLQFGPMFWTSVANAFKGNNAVVLDLFNEPFPERATGSTTTGWQCWRNGSTAANQAPCTGIPFAVAGFQTLLNAVRATGATNVVQIGGLAFSNDLTQWLANKPTDPTGNLMAFAHIYNFNSCSSTACFDSQLAPVAASVPLALTEIGENDCAHSFIDTVMSWADSHNVGYLGWTWNADFQCSSGPGLITDYTGTATAFGIGLKDHLNTVSN